MPRMNGTGPFGEGPMTGWGLGRCRGPQDTPSTMENRDVWSRFGPWGRRMGRRPFFCRWGGRNRGQGGGFRWRRFLTFGQDNTTQGQGR